MTICSSLRSTAYTPASSTGLLGKTVLRSTSYTIRPHPRSSGPEKFRRLAVGKKLTLYALHRLKALGIRNVVLATAETNKVASRLYESLGFKQFRRQVHYHLRIDDSSKNDS
jgi:hypothetical protein